MRMADLPKPTPAPCALERRSPISDSVTRLGEKQPTCMSGRHILAGITTLPTPISRMARCTGVSEHTRVFQGTTTAKESRGLVCGTEESDRTAPLALTTHEIRSRAVLSGSGCAEHQATGALPQPANPTAGPHRLKTRRRTRQHPPQPAQDRHQSQSFSTPTGVYAQLGGSGCSHSRSWEGCMFPCSQRRWTGRDWLLLYRCRSLYRP